MFIIASVLFASIIALMLLGLWGTLERAWQVWRTPTIRCGEVRVDAKRVAVRGVVSGLSTVVVSPATQTPCVFYSLRVSETRAAAKGVTRDTLFDESEHGSLIIEDETGAVEVNLHGADVHFATDFAGSTGVPATHPAIEALLVASGGRSGKQLDCQETVLKVGDEVYAFGAVIEGTQGFPELVSDGTSSVLVSDRPNPEIIRHRLLQAAGVTLLIGLFLLLWYGAYALWW